MSSPYAPSETLVHRTPSQGLHIASYTIQGAPSQLSRQRVCHQSQQSSRAGDRTGSLSQLSLQHWNSRDSSFGCTPEAAVWGHTQISKKPRLLCSDGLSRETPAWLSSSSALPSPACPPQVTGVVTPAVAQVHILTHVYTHAHSLDSC